MINHRLVVNWLKLLAGNECQWIETGAGAASEDEAFHRNEIGVSVVGVSEIRMTMLKAEALMFVYHASNLSAYRFGFDQQGG